ncbi:MAG: C39 family peptidase [Lachnospiraceae bacterium]|nr:C39 family peptidase [Lachnospiraceae bacterium]
MDEQEVTGFDLADRSEEGRVDFAKSAMEIDQQIMSRILARRMNVLVSGSEKGNELSQISGKPELRKLAKVSDIQAAQKGMAGVETKTINGAYKKTAKEAGKELAKKATKESGKELAKKAAKETAKRAAVETGKKVSQSAATEISKEVSAIVASSSATAISTTAGTAAGTVGTAGNPYGIVAGVAIGQAVGKTTEFGINVLDKKMGRNRSRREVMKSAMDQDKKMDVAASGGKRGIQEILYSVKSAIFATKLLLPGSIAAGIITLVVVLIIVFLMQISATGVMAVLQHQQENREIIGRLAGGQEVVYYNQHDYRDYPYGDSNISACGCGPTTMAMVVSTLTGETITPEQVADYCMDNNLYVWGAGTSHALFYRYDMNTTDYGNDLISALSVIPEGGMVILSVGMPDTIRADGSHALNGNEIYRGAGHIMAVRGVTEDGMILLADPNSRYNSETEWDYTKVSEILKRCWTVTYENDDTVVRDEQL